MFNNKEFIKYFMQTKIGFKKKLQLLNRVRKGYLINAREKNDQNVKNLEMLQGEISSQPRTVVNLALDSRSLVFTRYSKSIYIYLRPFSCKSQLCWWKPLTGALSLKTRCPLVFKAVVINCGKKAPSSQKFLCNLY